MRKSPHPYIKMTMGSMRLLRNPGKVKHAFSDSKLKVLGSHGESKGRKARPVLAVCSLAACKPAGRRS